MRGSTSVVLNPIIAARKFEIQASAFNSFGGLHFSRVS
ncbi:unnamed protein product [Rhodiola kirilowii]